MIRHKDSHVDHVSDEVLAFVLEKYQDRDGFFTDTFQLPDNFPELDCALYGPVCGDGPVETEETFMGVRPGREWHSVLVNRPVRKTRTCTVIAGPHKDDKCVLYTVFGGPKAPKECNDPNMTDAEWEESFAFWSQHALARNL